ncbi:MAG: response regulator [Polyangiaceae bacterium]
MLCTMAGTMLNVLVVDDDDIVRESVADALLDAGHAVQQARNGEKALVLITERSFDVAVCDVHMPGIGGLALFRQIRRKAPSTSVVFMTGFAKVEDAVLSLRDGATDYVSKPFDPVEFARDVIGPIAERRALRRRYEDAREQYVRRIVGSNLVGQSPPMSALANRISFLARTESSVIIAGEEGTEPELVARTIHSQSARRQGPLVIVSCETLAEKIFESEDEALSRSRPILERDAWFRAADGGTLILNDIDRLCMSAQIALLRAMDEPGLDARRDTNWRPHGVRLISTSHENMAARADAGLFLESLFYKLSGMSVTVPPLRDRAGDLHLLVSECLRDLLRPGCIPPSFTPSAWRALSRHSFPGNIVELRLALEVALARSAGESIDVAHLPREIALQAAES